MLRKAQKYQNKKAFQIKFDTKALQDQKKIKLDHLCKRCLQQIQWKMQFNKYKKQTEPSKCNHCGFKVVVKSYHQVCDPCAVEKDVCSKCMKSNQEVAQPAEVPILNKKEKEGMESKEEGRMNQYLRELRERSKRKVMREYEKGNYEWDDQGRRFLDKEGKEVGELKFKMSKEGDFGEDMDEEGDMDDMDEIGEDEDEQKEGGEEVGQEENGEEKEESKDKEQKGSDKEGSNIEQGDENDDDFQDDQDQDDLV